MHCLILDKLTVNECLLSPVYAAARESQKEEFWNHLKQLHNSINKLWCIMGDFNEMLNASEIIGGIPLSPMKVQRLNDFLTTVIAMMLLCKEGCLLGKNFYGAN